MGRGSFLVVVFFESSRPCPKGVLPASDGASVAIRPPPEWVDGSGKGFVEPDVGLLLRQTAVAGGFDDLFP
jgi:hypothetical protein